jgi:hypothetical protein
MGFATFYVYIEGHLGAYSVLLSILYATFKTIHLFCELNSVNLASIMKQNIK